MASDTLRKGEGMCTNKANLQVALLRAAGIPAGYVVVHVTKACFEGPQVLDEVLAAISPITVHVFCAAYIPYAVPLPGSRPGPTGAAEWDELGAFRHYDATERPGGSHFTFHEGYTDETRYQQRWLRGPFSPVQGNLDHLLTHGPHKLSDELRERQNELYRQHPI
jgi:hypothetical protein